MERIKAVSRGIVVATAAVVVVAAIAVVIERIHRVCLRDVGGSRKAECGVVHATHRPKVKRGHLLNVLSLLMLLLLLLLLMLMLLLLMMVVVHRRAHSSAKVLLHKESVLLVWLGLW